MIAVFRMSSTAQEFSDNLSPNQFSKRSCNHSSYLKGLACSAKAQGCYQINVTVITTRLPRPIFFGNHVQTGCPWWYWKTDSWRITNILILPWQFQVFWVKAAGFCKNWWVSTRVNVVLHSMGRIRHRITRVEYRRKFLKQMWRLPKSRTSLFQWHAVPCEMRCTVCCQHPFLYTCIYRYVFSNKLVLFQLLSYCSSTVVTPNQVVLLMV